MSTTTTTTTPVDQDTPLPIPNLVLPQLAFLLNEPKAESKRDGVLDKLLAGIEKDGMSSLSLCLTLEFTEPRFSLSLSL